MRRLRLSPATPSLRFIAAGVAAALVAIGVVVPATAASAVTYVACGDILSPSGLVAQVERANRSSGSEVTIHLTPGCNYVIPEPAWDYDKFGNKTYYDSAFWKINDTHGANTRLIVEGNGATISRGDSAGRIRFFHIGNLGDVVLKNLTLTGGQSPHGRPDGYVQSASRGEDGGAIYNEGMLTLENVTLTGNGTGSGENGDWGGSGDGYPGASGGRGGAIFNLGGLVITGSTVTNNATGPGGRGGDGLRQGGQGGSGGDGGAIYSSGTVVISSSTVSNNYTGSGGGGGDGINGSAPSYRGSGGAIAGYGTMSITRSLVANNNSEGTMGAEGGAVETLGGSLVVENSTFLGNKAWRGGAIHGSEATVAVRSSTFIGNDATGTGSQITGDVAALDRGSRMTFANTLLYGNDPTQVDCNLQVWAPAVSYTSLGGVLSDESSGCGTNTAIGDPKLEALGAWGGSTSSRLPRADSPLLGAGTAAHCLPVDQRGAARPLSGCDVGAVERVSVPTPGSITGALIAAAGTPKTYAATTTAGSAPLSYQWSVSGVGATISSTTAASPQITFSESGTAVVSLTVRVAGSSDGESVALAGLTVMVPPAGNTAPQLAWSGTVPTSVNEGDAARFTYTVTEAQGDAWALQSGSPSCGAGAVLVGSQVQSGGGYVDCSFPNGPTSPVVTVQVQDVWTSASTLSAPVTVAEVPPTIAVTGAATATEGSIVSYSYTIHESGSDVITPVTACAGGGASKVGGSDAFAVNGQDTTGTFQCRFGNGPATTAATVSANGTTASRTVTVSNVAPVIAISGPSPAAENGSTTQTYRYELNAVDPGDRSNLTLVDGSASCGGTGIGTVISADTTSVICRFAAGPASATVSATLRDQDGATSTGGRLGVQILNVAPVVIVGQPTGPVAEGSLVYFPLTATDAGLDTLTVTPPADCTTNFVESSPGRFSALMGCFYPDGAATVSRTIQVSDGTTTTTATIANQQVANAAPQIAASFTGWESWEGQSATLRIGSLTDAGRDTATSITINWGDGQSQTHAWPLTATEFSHQYMDGGDLVATIDVTDEDGTHAGASGPVPLLVRETAPTLFVTAPEEVSEGQTVTIHYTIVQPSVEAYDVTTVDCGVDFRYQPVVWSNLVKGPRGGSFDCHFPAGNNTYEVRLAIADSGGFDLSRTFVRGVNLPPVIEWTDAPTTVLEGDSVVHRFEFHVEDYSEVFMSTYSLYGGLTLMFGCGDGGTVRSGIPNGYGGTMPFPVLDPDTGDGYIDCSFRTGPTTASVKVTATDYRSQTIAVHPVTVLNVAPTVQLTGPGEPVHEGSAARFTYTTTDAGNDAVTATEASCGPDGTLLSEEQGSFSCAFDDGPDVSTATITVSDGDSTSSASAAATVVNLSPTGLPLSGESFFDIGEDYELDIGDTVDAGDDEGVEWSVHWGDGSTSVYTSRTPAPTHTYSDSEPHTITVDVTDEDGTYPALGTKALLQFDRVAPVLTVLEDATLEANHPDGHVWQWPRSAIDERDGALAVECSGYGFYGIDVFRPGVNDYDCWTTDAAGNRAEAEFTITVVDTTAPLFEAVTLGDINATSTAGAIVTWNTTATDAFDWQVEGTCDTEKNQLFAFGTYAVHCVATDRSGNTGALDFVFRVGDFAGPAISAPVTVVDEDAVDEHGAPVSFTQPTSWDSLDGAVPVVCSPASGSTFPLGDTTVDCSATDSGGNVATSTILVRVTDTTAPVVTTPMDAAAAPTGPDGVIVDFGGATAEDNVDGTVDATCAPASGSLFPLGVTVVTCSATDDASNTGTASFRITVQDEQAPVVTVPADIVVEATDADGEPVSYAGESAEDLVDGTLPATCDIASGAVLPIGATTVTCSATDSEGNVGTATFLITVADRTPPVVTASGDLTVEAAGALTPAGFASATAVDLVDGALAATCVPASGFSFVLGQTVVTCSASDAAGNTGSATFAVTIVDTTAPVVTGTDVTVGAQSTDGAEVTFAPTAVDILDGAMAPSCIPASGSMFPMESTTTVTCSATDRNGNTGSGSFVVTVNGALVAADAEPWDTEVEVSVDMFEVGDYVVVAEGTPEEEVRLVEALGSIILAAPLAMAHATGTTVSVIAAPANDVDAPLIAATDIGSVARGSSVVAEATCTDAGVGVEQCIVPALDTSTIGTRSITIRAWDWNGNVSVRQLQYSVVSPAALASSGADGVGQGLTAGVLLLILGAAIVVFGNRRRRAV